MLTTLYNTFLGSLAKDGNSVIQKPSIVYVVSCVNATQAVFMLTPAQWQPIRDAVTHWAATATVSHEHAAHVVST